MIGPCVNLFPPPYQMVDWKNIHFYVFPKNNPGLKHYPSGEMVGSPVSGKVNKATYDAPLIVCPKLEAIRNELNDTTVSRKIGQPLEFANDGESILCQSVVRPDL